jgi:hypothetical protein
MNASPLTPEQFEELLPLAAAWAEEQEHHILASGISLTTAQLSDARAVGVTQPERVRLLVVQRIPEPQHPILRAAAEATGLLGPGTAGLSLRYGIYLRQDVATNRHTIAHELVHTAQYERCGGLANFLRLYLHECLTIGYPAAPMEQEAIHASAKLFHGSA